jgi:hypothetical protein
MRRGTTAQWDANSTFTLLAGELGINTTTSQIKIGDGNSTWAQLDYINVAGLPGESGAVTTLQSAVTVTPTDTTRTAGTPVNISGLVSDLTAGTAIKFSITVTDSTSNPPHTLSPTTTYYLYAAAASGATSIRVYYRDQSTVVW